MSNQNEPNQPYDFSNSPPAVPVGPPTSAQQDQTAEPISGFPKLDNVVPNNLIGWGRTTEYITNMGLACSPVAAGLPAQKMAFWREESPSTYKVVSCIAVAAIGNDLPNPQLPHPDTGSANDVLLFWRKVNFSPKNFIDGSQVRAVLLVLVYALQQPIDLGIDVTDFGATPNDSTAAAAQTLNPNDYYSYLSSASSVIGQPETPINF